jgi:hypothetical protein
MNANLIREIEKEIGPDIIGKPMSEEMLDEASEKVIEFLEEKCPIPGLRDYLDGLKFIVEENEERSSTSETGGRADNRDQEVR